MADFLTEGKLNAALEEIFNEADKELIIISPYIKLHSRFIDILKKKKDNDKLRIIVVFGKNTKDKTRSIFKEDFMFLSEFPNIEIRYEERLHAKFYSNYNDSLLSSMNLYDYSQNNNIEFGILTKVSNLLVETVSGNHLDSDAYKYFKDIVIPNSKKLFENNPVYDSKLLGFSKKYISIENKIDLLSEEFGIKKLEDDIKKDKQSIEQTITISNKLMSATNLGKDKGLDYKQVVSKLSKLGLIDVEGKKATKSGLEIGIELKTTEKGSWLVYPESLKDKL